MTYLETARRVLKRKGGVARASDLLAAGVSAPQLGVLCRQGYITRIRHGWYQLADMDYISEEYLLATFIPEGVVCMESALFYYGYSDYTPRQWSIAIPRSLSASRVRNRKVPFKVYYVPAELYSLGKTREIFNDIKLFIYDRERTICDCFKYRTRLDSEMFNKAVNAYARDEHKNLQRLSQYACKMKLSTVVNQIMGVLLYE